MAFVSTVPPHSERLSCYIQSVLDIDTKHFIYTVCIWFSLYGWGGQITQYKYWYYHGCMRSVYFSINFYGIESFSKYD
jgi:hypothetical protein